MIANCYQRNGRCLALEQNKSATFIRTVKTSVVLAPEASIIIVIIIALKTRLYQPSEQFLLMTNEATKSLKSPKRNSETDMKNIFSYKTYPRASYGTRTVPHKFPFHWTNRVHVQSAQLGFFMPKQKYTLLEMDPC